jgi:hypothetical protein
MYAVVFPPVEVTVKLSLCDEIDAELEEEEEGW